MSDTLKQEIIINTSIVQAKRSIIGATIRILGATAALVLLVVFILSSASVLSGRWQQTPILTGSMSPSLPVGSIAISEREPASALQVGQIGLFHPPIDRSVTYIHKVVRVRHSPLGVEINTRGIANTINDPWTLLVRSKYVYVVHYDIPGLGYAIIWVRSPIGRSITLTTAGLLALALIASVLRDEHKRAKT